MISSVAYSTAANAGRSRQPLGTLDVEPGNVPHPRGEACPSCGYASQVQSPLLIKRGALEISRDPTLVTWRGNSVALSPTEAHVLAWIAVRGSASFPAIEAAMAEFGSNPATRRTVLMRIRSKFEDLGARNPLERIGHTGVRLSIEPDQEGSRATIIGLRAPF